MASIIERSSGSERRPPYGRAMAMLAIALLAYYSLSQIDKPTVLPNIAEPPHIATIEGMPAQAITPPPLGGFSPAPNLQTQEGFDSFDDPNYFAHDPGFAGLNPEMQHLLNQAVQNSSNETAAYWLSSKPLKLPNDPTLVDHPSYPENVIGPDDIEPSLHDIIFQDFACLPLDSHGNNLSQSYRTSLTALQEGLEKGFDMEPRIAYRNTVLTSIFEELNQLENIHPDIKYQFLYELHKKNTAIRFLHLLQKGMDNNPTFSVYPEDEYLDFLIDVSFFLDTLEVNPQSPDENVDYTDLFKDITTAYKDFYQKWGAKLDPGNFQSSVSPRIESQIVQVSPQKPADKLSWQIKKPGAKFSWSTRA
jgi:hypothetical protein